MQAVPFPSRAEREPRSPTRGQILLALLCIAAYANSLHTPFQFDDFVAFVNYHGARDLTHWWAAMPGIRPLLKLSYALNGELGSVLGYHLVNLALHLANTAMVFVLLQRWPGRPLSASAALAGAALFALHPAQTEAVTYLAGRSVSLMSLFYLAACLAWTSPTAPRRGRATVLFLAALASKETAVTLPLMLMLWECARQPACTMRQALRATAPLWSVLVLGLLVMAMQPRYRELLDFSLALRDTGSNLLAGLHGVTYLLTRPLLLLHLNIDPDLRVPAALTPRLALQGALLGVAAAVALAMLRRAPGASLAVLCCLLQFVPTHTLLPRLDLANDRQLYLALIGPAWLLASAFDRLNVWQPRVTPWLGLLLALGLATATAARNHDYRSEVALWVDTVRKSPHKPRPWNNLGYALRQQGEHAMAAAAYHRALELDPRFGQARINLGVMELQRELDTAKQP